LADTQAPQFLKSDGSRTLTGNLPVAGGVTIDGVDISAHAENPSAHHAPVTQGDGILVTGQLVAARLATDPGLEFSSGQLRAKVHGAVTRTASGIGVAGGDGIVITSAVHVDLADTPGLEFNAAKLRVRTGDGLDRHSTGVRVVLATNPGLEFDTGLLRVRAGAGIERTADGTAVRLATNSGLTLGSSVLALGTPSEIAWNSAAGVSASNHVHSIATSNNPGANAIILRSTGAGGLTLESIDITGAATVGQSLFSGNNTLRAIYHTHDYPHTHLVINPGPLWNLDEQFGVDIDDNLLVRGWIVGKHAIQLEGATLLAHFDGPQPYETNFVGTLMGHMGQVGTPNSDAVIFRPGKFGKAVQCARAATNHIRNPRFQNNVTTAWGIGSSDSSATRTRDPATSVVGQYSCRLNKNTADWAFFRSNGGGTTITLSESSATASLWVRASGGTVTIDIRNSGSGDIVASATVGPDDANKWVYRKITWENPTAAVLNYHMRIEFGSATGPVWIDAVQMEETPYATPYLDGDLPGHSWTGTAHNSTSTRPAAFVTYGEHTQFMNPREGTIMFWYHVRDAVWLDVSENRNLIGVGAFDTANTIRFIKRFNQRIRFYIRGPSGSAVELSTVNTQNQEGWYFVTATWSLSKNETTLRIYNPNGTMQEASGAYTASVPDLTAHANFGIASMMNGLVDDLTIAGRALDADEIRAIYESNAPVFAETSTWHWRAGRNRVWADSEGLWAVGANSGAILGLYAGDDENPAATKSWGGLSLSEGDFLLGNTSNSYLFLDRDNETIELSLSDGTTELFSASDAGVQIHVGTSLGNVRGYTFTRTGDKFGGIFGMRGASSQGIDVAAGKVLGLNKGDVNTLVSLGAYTDATRDSRAELYAVRDDTIAGRITIVNTPSDLYIDMVGALRLQSQATPAVPSISNMRMYFNAPNLIIQYRDGSTTRYKYLNLSGTGTTWTHSTTAP
jgi:hypothetical protein